MEKGYTLRNMDVRGDTAITTTTPTIHHPVVLALHERSKYPKDDAGKRLDGRRVAIAIEGGGMRGCVSAGMISAIWYLDMVKAIDVVYGSSAGALIGAYFVSGQFPYSGPEIYYDLLTSAGTNFIDKLSILRSTGFGLLDLRWSSLKNLVRSRIGRPVLNLDYLLDNTLCKQKPLSETFWKHQVDKTMELKVIASGLLTEQPVVLSAASNNFQTTPELALCLKASMAMPGITGEVIRLRDNQVLSGNIATTWWRDYSGRWDNNLTAGSEPLLDALIYEPIPYRSAVNENCTDILVLRTRPDNITVTGKAGLVTKLIGARFFGRKQGLPNLQKWMNDMQHRLRYAEDMLVLNEANKETIREAKGHYRYTTGQTYHSLFTIALPSTSSEVTRMETNRSVILLNMRDGFASAFDALVLDSSLKGKGMDIAFSIWPAYMDAGGDHPKVESFQEERRIILQKEREAMEKMGDSQVKSSMEGDRPERFNRNVVDEAQTVGQKNTVTAPSIPPFSYSTPYPIDSSAMKVNESNTSKDRYGLSSRVVRSSL